MFGRILKSSVFKSSGIYTISSLISASIPFLLIPILTRVFSTEDYGIVSMAALIINIITPFIGVSAHGAIHRRYFEKDFEMDFPRYVGNTFFLLLISSLIFLILFTVFGFTISSYTRIPITWLYVILLIALCQFTTLILFSIWQVKVKPLKYGLLQIIQSLINVGLSLLFIYQLSMGWESRVLGQFIAVLITAIFSMYVLIKNNLVVFCYNKDDLKDILSFGVPLIPHTLGGLIITFTDRILITDMIGISETGVYTVAYQIGSVLSLINVSFVNAYLPWLYEKLNLNDYKTKIKIVRFTYIYFACLILVAIVSTLFGPRLVEMLVGKSFYEAGKYTIWIVLGYVFNGMYLMVVGFIFYAKKTALLSKITISIALINIPLCYLFLKHFGTVGAGISMTIVYFASFIFTWILSNRVVSMPWFRIRE